MKGYIYAIRSHQTELVYIGSTTQILCKIMSDHRKTYYVSSYDIVKHTDAYIELIEEGEFESIEALHARKGFHIRKNICVNIVIPKRTAKEYYQDNKEKLIKYQNEYRTVNSVEIAEKAKQYYIENKEERKQYYQDNKERSDNYYKDNKAHILERQNTKVVCECGCKVSKGNLPAHIKSKKHESMMKMSN